MLSQRRKLDQFLLIQPTKSPIYILKDSEHSGDCQNKNKKKKKIGTLRDKIIAVNCVIALQILLKQVPKRRATRDKTALLLMPGILRRQGLAPDFQRLLCSL